MLFRFSQRIVLAFGVITGVIGSWVFWRAFGPEPKPHYTSQQVRPLRYTGRTAIVGEYELFFRDIGDPAKPVLVLLHGAGFDGESSFYRVIPGLADKFRLIVPDHRAHGKSDRVRGRMDIADLADDLAGLLGVLGIDRVSVFGYSMGGMVAQDFAARYPDRTERLVLGATTDHAFNPVRVPIRGGMWMARGFTRISNAEQIYANFRILRATGAVTRRHERWLWNAMKSRDTALYWESALGLYRFDGRDAASEITSPTMQLITANDQVIRRPMQEGLAGRLRAPVVVEIEAGHEAIMTHPDEFITHVSDFLAVGVSASVRDAREHPT